MSELPQTTFSQQAGESERSLSPFLTFSPALFALVAIAALCGAAAGGLLQSGSLQWALMAMVLAGAWQVLWSALARMNWQPARAAWHTWSRSASSRRLPYTQPGSDADKAGNDLALFSAWAREWLLPQHGAQLGMALAAFMVMLALALALGMTALLLSVVMLVTLQIALALCGGNGKPATWAQGLVTIGLPFALGYAALAPLSWPMGLACLAMGLALMAVFAGDAILLHVASLISVVAFVLLREPAAAFVMGVAWATTAFLKPARHRLALVTLCLFALAAAWMV